MNLSKTVRYLAIGGWKPPTKKRAKVTGEHVHAYIVAGYKKMTVWAPAYF